MSYITIIESTIILSSTSQLRERDEGIRRGDEIEGRRRGRGEGRGENREWERREERLSKSPQWKGLGDRR